MSRSGYKWNVNECLRLQREYELLQLPISEIARLHKRTIKAIMYKLDEEKIADYNELASKEQLNMESEQAESEPKPKRVRSPYVLFCEEKRPEVRACHPNVSLDEREQILAQMWLELDDAGKEKYVRAISEGYIKMIFEPKPKSKLSPAQYYKFCNENANKVRKMLPDAPLAMAEMDKMLSFMWSHLDEASKAEYCELSCKEHHETTSNQTEEKSKSPYVLFCEEKRPELRASWPNASFGEMGAMLGQMWSQLDDASKEKYIDLACNERLKMIPEPKSDPYHVFSKPYYKFCNEKSNKVNQMFPDANIIEKGKIYQLLWSQLDEAGKAKYVR
jgi:HMG (high mobility group) box